MVLDDRYKNRHHIENYYHVREKGAIAAMLNMRSVGIKTCVLSFHS